MILIKITDKDTGKCMGLYEADNAETALRGMKMDCEMNDRPVPANVEVTYTTDIKEGQR
jgi:hypothetical protein